MSKPPKPFPPHELVAEARDGGETAFWELFASVQPIALHYAKRYTPLDMDDCLQEMRLRPFDKLRTSLWQKLRLWNPKRAV